MFFGDDDVQVSEAPTTTNAVEFTLRADLDEVGSWVELYLKADDGYVLTDGATITPTGDTAAKWQLAPDDSGSQGTPEDYGDPLVLTDPVADDAESTFWIRAKATNDEVPVNDVTVTLVVTGIASAE